MTHLETNKIGYDTVFESKDGELPVLLSLYLSKKVTIESLRILDDMENYLQKWETNSSIMIAFEQEVRRIKKLTGFVKYDRIKADKIFSHFKEEFVE
jgi:hypothetical protein